MTTTKIKHTIESYVTVEITDASVHVNRYILVFFQNPRSWHHCHIYVTSNENKLDIVANQMNSNTNLDLSRAYRIKTNVSGN